MISADDFSFHPRDPTDAAWTETLFLIFSVPEAGISGNLYTLARPNLGICHSSIEIHRGFCLQPWKIHHNDPQMHLPCPEDFSEFKLANGLQFEARSARECHFSYRALDGNCALDIDFRALCDPFDPHDPVDNPLTSSAKLAGYEGWNTGHMESKGRMTGSLSLRGIDYRVDCVDGMNKSWGPRHDWGHKGATWVQISLGAELDAFMVLGLSFHNKEVVYGPFHYGYIVERGARRPLVGGSMVAQRAEMLVMRAKAELEDSDGRRYEVFGTTVAAAPWYNFNPSSAAFQTLMRWESAHGIGYSHIADFAGLGYLAAGLADEFEI